VKTFLEALRTMPGYWLNRFQKFATDMEKRERAGEFGKWPWQRDYGLWPWQRRRKP
jgi:hypothetical protein